MSSLENNSEENIKMSTRNQVPFKGCTQPFVYVMPSTLLNNY